MFVLTNATLKMRGLAFFLLLSVKIFSQPIDCCPDAPTVVTSTTSMVIGTESVIISGSWMSSGKNPIIGVGFLIGQDPFSMTSHVINSQRTFFSHSFNTSIDDTSTYYYQAFAFSLTDTGFGEIKSFTRGFICGESRIVDIDGNIYETVQIGAQCWMKSNLKTTHYKNGDPIPYNVVWEAQNTTDARTEPAADFNNVYALNFGWLYKGYAANDPRGICPDGWHIPTQSEWNYLSHPNIVGSNPGNALKSNTSDWHQSGSGTPNGTNSSGFSGLPAGVRWPNGFWDYYFNYRGYWWSSSATSIDNYFVFGLFSGNQQTNNNSFTKSSGASCRCIRD